MKTKAKAGIERSYSLYRSPGISRMSKRRSRFSAIVFLLFCFLSTFYACSHTDSGRATADNSSVTTVESPATALTFYGPSWGTAGSASINFTVAPDDVYAGTITPSTTGAGSFSPASLTWTGSSEAKTFTYTPSSTSGSPHTISVSSSPSLSNSSGNISFEVYEKAPYYQILSTGQSLSLGCHVTPAISTTQPYNNLMLTPGVEGTTGPFIPLIESGKGYWKGAETISSGMANSIHAYENLSSPIVVSLHGADGGKYSGLKKNSNPYKKGMAQASITKTYVENTLGEIYRPIAVTAIHGESDYTSSSDLPKYENNLKQWQSDYQNDLNALTGRSDTIPLFINQMSAGKTGELADAQLNAHKNNPGKIILVAPKYQYHYMDNFHMDVNTEEKHMGEMFAKVISLVLFEGKTWHPLMPTKIERTGAVILVQYHIPYGTLAIDTSYVAERQNYGFEFTQTGGNSVYITLVELVNGNSQVKITLSDTPTGTNQRLKYAQTCLNPAAGHYCANALNSLSVGGNIRDTDTRVSPSLDSTGIPLYDWGVAFNEPITSVSN